jgi:hypothetical protein
MKEYTFKVENKGNNSNNISDNNALNEMLLTNIFNKYPYMDTNKNMNLIPKYNLEDIIGIFGDPHKTTNKDKDLYIYFEGNNFTEGHDDYDFMLGNTPVKDRGDFVQVGYDLIPRKYFPMSLYMNSNHRIVNREVIDIIIKIKKHKSFYII